MKKFLLAIFALSMLFASCSKDSTPVNTENMITMSAGVVDDVFKVWGPTGPINSGFTASFPIGVYANNGSWLAGATANWINNDTATVAGAAGHAVTFGSGPYYYPSDGSTLNFYAFAPRGTETTAATVGGSPVVTIPITGQEDVMWANSTGYKIGSNAAVPPALSFGHQLTQLQFTFKAGTGYPTAVNKVVSLQVKAQPTSAVMTVGTGVVAFTGSASMQALSTANQTAGITITSTGANANSPVITKTAAGATAYLLDVVVKPASGSNVTYSNIPVNVTSVAGNAHMITLTFVGTTITCSASVVDWASGSPGSGVVQ